ncbi:hypothetical protein CAC42_7288 [Sphaceloma murrayae]|uniref:Uncharacterized protein n=1 Tax=Sphaceloma murrayae TaxID=2082308 RepID=A0A2K1QWL3_9PEZI|nr:hypothetical protein CAC42_7288 [Sphaceloma murrayae]
MSPPPPLPVPAPLSSTFSERSRDVLERIRRMERNSRARLAQSSQQQDQERSGTSSQHIFGAGRLEAPEVPPRSGRRSLLPTPPLEMSEQSSAAAIAPATVSIAPAEAINQVPTITVQPTAGLGDRVRSPSPMTPNDDAWQIIRETIPADGNLPSADSSFASAAASASFTTTANAAQTDSQSTAPDHLANPSETQSSQDQDLDCIYDSDNSSSTFIHHGRMLPPSMQGLRDAIRDEIRSEMADGFLEMQTDYENTLFAYDDELSSLRQDFNAMREHVRRLDPSAPLPPAYPPLSPVYRQALRSALLPRPLASNDTPPYPPNIQARSRDAISRTEVFFSPYRGLDAVESQHHLGVDRDGQLQLLPRDRTLTRVPSLRREESQRESQEPPNQSILGADSLHALRVMRDERTGRVESTRESRLNQSSNQDTRRTALRRQRSRMQNAVGTGDGSSSYGPTDDVFMWSIMHRLSERRDVPDGMWMGAGLSRDVVEPREAGPTMPGREAERREVRLDERDRIREQWR